MLPYWLLFALCAVGAIQYRPGPAGRAEPTALLNVVIWTILLMIGFRYEVGGDWRNYLTFYDSIRFADLWEAIAAGDPAYSVLNWMAHRLGQDMWFINLPCAAVFAWGLGRFVKTQPNPWLALTIAVPYLVIVVAMGYTRQAAAIGLELAALADFRKHRSLVRIAVLVVIGAAFHKTAVVVFPLLAMSIGRNRLFTIGAGAMMVVALYYAFVAASADSLFAGYIQDDYDAAGVAVRTAMNVLPAVIFLLFRRNFGVEGDERRLWTNFSYASLVILAALGVLQSTVVLDRLALYLIPLQIFVLSRLPIAIEKGRSENGLMALGVIGYYAAVQFVWLTSAAHAHYWVPYHAYSPV